MISTFNYKILLSFFILLSLFTMPYGISKVTSEDNKPISELNNIRNFIDKYFHNYEIMEIEGLDPFLQNYFRKHYPQLNPCIVYKDLDGNGLVDFGVLLKNLVGKKDRTIFAIFLHTNKNHFEPKYYQDMEFYRDDVYILPIESGSILKQTESIDAPYKEVRLKNAAIELVYFEKSSVAYYWEEGKKDFASIWTSD